MKETEALNLGIDLGTTNSAAASVKIENGKLYTPMLKIERFLDIANGGRGRERRELLPSCVTYWWDKNEWVPVVGDAAKKRSYISPSEVATSVKDQMGNEKVSYTDWDQYPDQTPQAISARIIRHILDAAENMYGEDVSHAVITVPASFGAAQKQATLMAAKLAGIEVEQLEDGTYNDDMLLSEPEAVIYAVLTQQSNGELDLRCDFSTPKKVMVYDIGGGTLDVTLHEIQADKDNFNFKTIATNRFSKVAGNAFDTCLAEWMWEKWMDEQNDRSVKARIEGQKERCMPQLLRWAEQVKEEFSSLYLTRKQRGKDVPMEEDRGYGGGIVGYELESVITRKQFEDCLRPLMGENLTFEDYRRFDALGEYEHTILYPVLDVLAKGAKKLNTTDLKVDMVILNGGMTRLYLIKERLERFFGFPMTSVSNPDLTVAQGAAIYNYYRTLAREEAAAAKAAEQTARLQQQAFGFQDVTAHPEEEHQRIRSLGTVLNEDICLGLQGGNVITLAEAGSDLPYSSEIKDGFGLTPGINRIDIPIKEKRGKTYVTVARGCIRLDKEIHATLTGEQKISIQYSISRNGILSLFAWLQEEKRPLGQVEILLGDDAKGQGNSRMVMMHPPAGTNLMASNEMDQLAGLLERIRGKFNNTNLSNQIRQKKNEILHCGNPQDFAKEVLKLLENYDSHIVFHIIPLARKLSKYWTQEQCGKLAEFCEAWIRPLLERNAYFEQKGRVNANIEVIKTMGVLCTEAECEKLAVLQSVSKYENALLYTFAYKGIQLKWITHTFLHHLTCHQPMQDVMQMLGLAFYRCKNMADVDNIPKITEKIISFVRDGHATSTNILNVAIVTLGFLCRGKDGKFLVPEPLREEALFAIRNLSYNESLLKEARKAIQTAEKLIHNEPLEEEEDQYLLKLLDKDR